MSLHRTPKLAIYLYGLICLIVVLVPFHGFLTTWAGSTFGNLLLWRAWKEMIVLLALVAAVILLVRDRDLRQVIFGKNKPLVILVVVFTLWQFASVIFGGQNVAATVSGLVIQLRTVVIFAFAAITAYYIHTSQSRFNKLILIPACLVVIFGLLQIFALPYDFLKHFGYIKEVTIPPFFTIDEQIDQIRIASTLRGPNPLGVYLILPTLLIIGRWKTMSKNRKNMIAASMLLVSSLVVLFGSHSRGAWLGLAGAFGVWVLLTVPKRLGGLLLIAGTALVMVAAFGTYQYRDTDFVQDVVLHDNPSEGGDISSNQGHLQSLEDGIENVAQSPVIGCGAGCAGPASVRSDGGAQFSENYFIQTAEESGVVGLGLLIAIFSYVAYLLYKRKDEDFARVLLASFVGIGVASLTAHAWADDTIAYIWWGIAGLYLYNKSVGISNGKTKNKIT